MAWCRSPRTEQGVGFRRLQPEPARLDDLREMVAPGVQRGVGDLAGGVGFREVDDRYSVTPPLTLPSPLRGEGEFSREPTFIRPFMGR